MAFCLNCSKLLLVSISISFADSVGRFGMAHLFLLSAVRPLVAQRCHWSFICAAASNDQLAVVVGGAWTQWANGNRDGPGAKLNVCGYGAGEIGSVLKTH